MNPEFHSYDPNTGDRKPVPLEDLKVPGQKDQAKADEEARQKASLEKNHVYMGQMPPEIKKIVDEQNAAERKRRERNYAKLDFPQDVKDAIAETKRQMEQGAAAETENAPVEKPSDDVVSPAKKSWLDRFFGGKKN